MIAADTSTWIAYFKGQPGEDVELLDRLMDERQVWMVPAVLAELFSDPSLPTEVAETLLDLPMLETEAGYWKRAGQLRSRVLAQDRKARLGDALIAQSCLDHRLALLTRDHDFHAFSLHAGLHLVAG